MSYRNSAASVLAFLALVAIAYAGRTPAPTVVSGGSAGQTWQNCHHELMTKFHAATHWHASTLPKGLRHMALPSEVETTNSQATEGIACTWEELFVGVDVCITNWKQFNKTLTPANDVSRAAANLHAKGYVCGLNSDVDACGSVDHCRWDDQWSLCSLSSFFFTLQFACHDSPVRKVSICIDFAEDRCKRDPRCEWHAFPSNPQGSLCLPDGVPTDWSAEQVDQWLVALFNNDSTYFTNWGDCPTSHAWQQLTSCGKHAGQDSCQQDGLCIWLGAINTCTIKPEKFVDLMWGGDVATYNALTAREKYCHNFKATDACVRAMPNVAA